MPEIMFKSVPRDELEALKKAFGYIAESKANESFSESGLAEIMGEKVNNYFVNPTKEESDEMIRKWKLNPDIELPWDFGSWFDALESAEIAYLSLELSDTGDGKLVFEQLAWPSGGIDASEEILKAFGAVVVSNNGI